MKKLMFLMIACCLPLTTLAGSEAKVFQVYVCSNNVFLQTDRYGWLVVEQAVVGETQAQRMFEIGIKLVETKMRTGFIDTGNMVKLCGLSAHSITVLGIRHNIGPTF